MKKIFKFGLLALFLGLTSCEDATDITQESELSEEAAFRTVGDLETGLNGVYAAYGPDFGSNGAGDVILFNDLFTDNIKRGITSSGQGNQEYGFILQPGTDFPTRIWGNRYATINFANRVLSAWDRVVGSLEAGDSDIRRANQIKAQLLAMRALCHFDLLQYFAENYQNRNGLGVIKMDFVPEITDRLQRNTVGEIFDFVNEDLDSAQSLIGNFSSPQNSAAQNVFYIRQDVINAIRARVALFEGNNTLAQALSTDLIAEYPLADPNQYAALWQDQLTPNVEVIFALSRARGANAVGGLFYANETNIDGAPFFEMSNQLYDLYSDNDVRKFVFVDETSELDNSESRVLLINKYPGGSADLLVNHIKLFRTSEMVLIKAEAEARIGNLAAAAASLQSLRVARYLQGVPPQPVFANLNQALSEILLERRKELCFEGHRYLDLKRIGREIGVGINRDPRDCASFSAQCDLAPNDYRFTLPIPQSEISANPTITQNPNY